MSYTKDRNIKAGILPKAGGEQYEVCRSFKSGKGSVVGKDMVIESAEDINISKSEKALDAEIQVELMP